MAERNEKKGKNDTISGLHFPAQSKVLITEIQTI